MNISYIEQRRNLKLNGATAPTKQKEKHSVTSLLKEAEEVFNRFIRLRDKGRKCICGCGKPGTDAGHFYPKTYSKVRFDELNVNLQARDCNYFGKKVICDHYKQGLIERVGFAAVNRLIERAMQPGAHKWQPSELIALIEKYEKKVNELTQTKTKKAAA